MRPEGWSPDALLDLLHDEVFQRPGSDVAFNPYRDRNPDLCRENAPELRRRNLERYLRAFRRAPPVLLVGEAPSWRGMRFSGVPFTSEAQLADPDFPLDGDPTSRRRRPLSEPSATILWSALRDHWPDFVLWNAFPFHPHPAGRAAANRTPRRGEVREFRDVVRRFVDLASPERVVAVGRTAERCLHDLDLDCAYVRHPAQGGATRFREGIGAFFR